MSTLAFSQTAAEDNISNDSSVSNDNNVPSNHIANNYQSTPERSNFKFFIIAVILAIIITSCILSSKGYITVYYNYTDVASSFLIFIVPFVLIFIILHIIGLTNINHTQTASKVITSLSFLSSIPFIIFCSKISIIHNDKIWKIILSIISKFLLPCLIIILFICSLAESKRREGESEAAYNRRVKKEVAAKLATVTALTVIIFKFLIRNRKYDSISDTWHSLP
jgi:hypothetical protein